MGPANATRRYEPYEEYNPPRIHSTHGRLQASPRRLISDPHDLIPTQAPRSAPILTLRIEVVEQGWWQLRFESLSV